MVRNYLPFFKIRICTLITFSAVVGLLSASTRITPATVAFLIIATMMASMGASAFNHWFDMDIDTVMKRTGGRPIPAGLVDSRKVVVLAILLFSASLFLSTLALNRMVALHLFLGGVTYAVVYTAWLKRRSSINIVIGGLAGSFAVLAGGASAEPGLCLLPVLLAVTMFFWTPSHFWSFAIFHREDYERAGVPMLPVVSGERKTVTLILINTVVLVASSLLPFFFGLAGPVYLAGAVAFGVYFISRSVALVRNPSKQNAWRNFKASMLYLGGLFAGVILDIVART